MPTQEQIQAAINVMNDHGIDFRAPWECTLDDREQERFEALRDAIGAALFSAPAQAAPDTREAMTRARAYIEYAIEMHGPDPAGDGLSVLNALDRALAAQPPAAPVDWMAERDGICGLPDSRSSAGKESDIADKLRACHQQRLALWEAVAGGPEPRCRDCADFDGRCQGDGLPCDPQERALERIKRLRTQPQTVSLIEAAHALIDQYELGAGHCLGVMSDGKACFKGSFLAKLESLKSALEHQ